MRRGCGRAARRAQPSYLPPPSLSTRRTERGCIDPSQNPNQQRRSRKCSDHPRRISRAISVSRRRALKRGFKPEDNLDTHIPPGRRPFLPAKLLRQNEGASCPQNFDSPGNRPHAFSDGDACRFCGRRFRFESSGAIGAKWRGSRFHLSSASIILLNSNRSCHGLSSWRRGLNESKSSQASCENRAEPLDVRTGSERSSPSPGSDQPDAAFRWPPESSTTLARPERIVGADGSGPDRRRDRDEAHATGTMASWTPRLFDPTRWGLDRCWSALAATSRARRRTMLACERAVDSAAGRTDFAGGQSRGIVKTRRGLQSHS